jgi:peptide/nickel transport system substrate-binding protein
MRKARNVVSLLLGCVMLISAFSTFAQSAEKAILRAAYPSDVVTWDAYNTTILTMFQMAKLVYDPLIAQTVEGKLMPCLATEWKGNSNATEWTFKLRKGVAYHNGEAFNAQSVKASIGRFLNEKLSGGSNWKTLASVEATDEFTVVMKFSAPNGALPYTLVSTPMLCPSQFKDGPTGLDKAIGTGAYKFVEWQKGNKISLVRNDNYWGNKAKFQKLEYLPITEDSTRIAGVQTGAIDIAESIPPDSIKSLENDKSVRVVKVLAIDQLFFGVSVAKPPFNNKLARQAINLGLDRESMVRDIMNGGRPSTCLLPKGMLGFDPSLPEIKRDLAKAKDLLKKSGYAGEPVSLIVPIGWYPKLNEQAQALMAQLKEVGFNIKLEMLEANAYLAKRNAGDYNLYITGAAHQAGDPDMFLSTRVMNDYAKSGYKNDNMNNWINKAREGTTTEARQASYEKVMKIIADDCAPIIPIYQMQECFLVNPSVDIQASKEVFRTDKCMDLKFVQMKAK